MADALDFGFKITLDIVLPTWINPFKFYKVCLFPRACSVKVQVIANWVIWVTPIAGFVFECLVNTLRGLYPSWEVGTSAF